MVPGGAAMHMALFWKSEGISCIANLHEQIIAARSLFTYNLASVFYWLRLVLVVQMQLQVAGAWLDSTPVICISGQVKLPT